MHGIEVAIILLKQGWCERQIVICVCLSCVFVLYHFGEKLSFLYSTCCWSVLTSCSQNICRVFERAKNIRPLMYYYMEDHLIHLCLTYFVLPHREWRKLRSIPEGGHQLGKGWLKWIKPILFLTNPCFPKALCLGYNPQTQEMSVRLVCFLEFPVEQEPPTLDYNEQIEHEDYDDCTVPFLFTYPI